MDRQKQIIDFITQTILLYEDLSLHMDEGDHKEKLKKDLESMVKEACGWLQTA